MENYTNYKHSALTGKVIKAAYYVFDYFGFGFVESIYEKSLAIQLRKTGLKVARQQPIHVYFEGELVGDFKADLVINDKVIVELKAVESLSLIHI